MTTTQNFPKTRDLWERGRDPSEWADGTPPDGNLLWKSGHPSQVTDLLAIGHLLDLPVRVVGQHTSKSVGLPVGMFEAQICGEETVHFFTRNNFYNLKLVVVSSCPITMGYDAVHRRMTAEGLLEEKQRCYEYRKGGKNFDAADFDNTDAWFDGWCGDTLLRVDGEIWRCGTTYSGYYEGMEEAGVPASVFQRYERGRTDFAVEIHGGVVELMRAMRSVQRAAQRHVMDRRDEQRDRKRHAELSAKDVLTDYEGKDLAEVTDRLHARGALDGV